MSLNIFCDDSLLPNFILMNIAQDKRYILRNILLSSHLLQICFFYLKSAILEKKGEKCDLYI